MKKFHLLFVIACILFSNSVSSQATSPFTTCPNVNLAVLRAGLNSDVTNPNYIYSVNTSNGTLTQLPGGPLHTPGNPAQNLQVNGVGINTADGYMYGLVYEGSVNTANFARFDKNYGVTLFGDLTPPTSPTGAFGFVNSAAGDVDRSNNYYFSAFTANVSGAGIALDKLFLGKISNISTLAGTPTVQYFNVDYSDLPCSNYITTLTTDPNNSGLKDFVYNPVTNTFFSYLTYKPTGAANFSGQLVEVRPVTGSSPLQYKMYCNGTVNTHTAETSGTLIDNSGNFEVLFTDGSIIKLNSTGTPFNYNGTFTTLNAATGLPNPLRGDMASCGGAAGGPLPVRLTSFNAVQQNCLTSFSWSSATELNLSHYELEQSFDGISFSFVSNIGLNNNKTYRTTLASPGQQAYYRIKAVDMDGNYTYSNILGVANGCGKELPGFLIAPNPARDAVNLSWYGIQANTVMEITIYNNLGKAMQKVTKSVSQGTTTKINIGNLPAGIYYVKGVDTQNNTMVDAKFIKQ